MTPRQFAELLTMSIGWECQLAIQECADADCSYSVSLTLWEKTITDCFAVHHDKWFSEGGSGIMVDSQLTVWQWVAMRFADQIGGNVE